MSQEMITQLPQAASANLSDITMAVQGYSSPTVLGTSVQETWRQVLELIQAGDNISISFGANSLVISSTGPGGVEWFSVSTNTQLLAAGSGYVTNNGSSLVTFTLPATATFGSIIYIQGLSAGGWRINTNGGQNIIIGDAVAGTYIASTNQYDSIVLLCASENTTFTSLGGPQGQLAYA